MRRGWRLRWTLQQFIDFPLLRRNRELLDNPGAYYASILLKFVSGIYRRPVQLCFRRSKQSILIESFMTAFIYREIFVDSDYDLALDTTTPTILDIGANTGLFALRMKQLYPAAQIVCLEPDQSNFNQLQRLIGANQLDGVRPVCKGVGAQAGSATLYLNPHNLGGHSVVKQQAQPDWGAEAIELVSLADVLQMFPAGAIFDLMKLDCEGAEYDIIRNMDVSMAQRIRCIVFESSPSLYNTADLVAHLESLGYSLVRRRERLFQFRLPAMRIPERPQARSEPSFST